MVICIYESISFLFHSFCCDNKSSIHITHNLIFHEQMKHIELDCHVTRRSLKHGTIALLLLCSFCYTNCRFLYEDTFCFTFSFSSWKTFDACMSHREFERKLFRNILLFIKNIIVHSSFSRILIVLVSYLVARTKNMIMIVFAIFNPYYLNGVRLFIFLLYFCNK